jgi:hypothetical protein
LTYANSGTSPFDYQRIGLFSDTPTNNSSNPNCAFNIQGSRANPNPNAWYGELISNLVPTLTTETFTALPSQNVVYGFRIVIYNYVRLLRVEFYENTSDATAPFSLVGSLSTTANPVVTSPNFYVENFASASGTNVSSAILHNYSLKTENNYIQPLIRDQYFFNDFLSQDGLGVTIQATGDYSVTSTDFKIIASRNETFISRVIIKISDATISSYEDYGGLSALTNGVLFFVKRAETNKEYINQGFPIISNGDYVSLMYDGQILSGGGNDYFTARWSFNKSSQNGIVLNENDEFGMELSDDFTGLITHTFNVQGYFV